MSSETLTIGVLPLGAADLRCPLCRRDAVGMWRDLEAPVHPLDGRANSADGRGSCGSGNGRHQGAKPDRILILQVTFTDAVMTCRIAESFDQPLAIWAVPEPRLGGRLRLNAFCGLNLASHALSLRGRLFSWRYAAPGEGPLDTLFGATPMVHPLASRAVWTLIPLPARRCSINSGPRVSPESARIRTGLTPVPISQTGFRR
jgi:hypothetical protein